MRYIAGSTRASGGKSTYDAQYRSAGSLANAVQIDHPLSTVPAAEGSPGMADRTLLFWRAVVTDFLPADGQGAMTSGVRGWPEQAGAAESTDRPQAPLTD
jgi:hypothetical protein